MVTENDEEKQALIQAISAAVLAAMREAHHDGLDEEVHKSHHEFITLVKKREERRIKFMEKIAETVTGSVILSLLASLVAALGYAALNWLKQNK